MSDQAILIIDDDVQLVDSIKTLLESVGYQVMFAYQPHKGIALVKENLPDLILLDVMFAGPPGPDGFEIARALHDDPYLQKIPIIMLSGIRKSLELHFNISPDEKWMPVKAFLDKPVKPRKLLAEIEKVLGPLEDS